MPCRTAKETAFLGSVCYGTILGVVCADRENLTCALCPGRIPTVIETLGNTGNVTCSGNSWKREFLRKVTEAAKESENLSVNLHLPLV